VTDRLSPTPEDAERALDRLADRLHVVGPRLAARQGEEAAAALERVRAGLQRLADLASAAEGVPDRAVPRLGAHALADQALVLGSELLAGPAGSTDARRAAVVAEFDRLRGLLDT
jgi:hypothetical protein